MIALQITDVKIFMNKLLRSELFDSFLLSEAQITTSTCFTIDGTITKDYYTDEEKEELHLMGLEYTPYALLRPVCFDLIKGKKTPPFFRFILQLSPGNLEHVLAKSDSGLSSGDVKNACMILTYQNGHLTITTGVSYQTFIPTHQLDQEWDAMVRRFLLKSELNFEEL